jgi:Spy/CpxP family protein refolding chaperone
MKHYTLTMCVAAAALFAIPTAALAQDKPAGEAPERGERGERGRGRFSPEERLKRMTEALGLTQEQQDKMKAIYEKNAPVFKELMAKGRENLTEEDKTKFRELMKAQGEAIKAVLTPEQKEKAKAEREKRRAEWEKRRGQRRQGGEAPAGETK